MDSDGDGIVDAQDNDAGIDDEYTTVDANAWQGEFRGYAATVCAA